MRDIHTMLITTLSDRTFTSEGRFQSHSGRVGCVRDKVALGQIHLRKLWFPLSELFTDASCSFTRLPSTTYNLSTWRRHLINFFFSLSRWPETWKLPSFSSLPISDGLIILDSSSIFIEVLLQCYSVKITCHLRTTFSHLHAGRQ